MEEKLKEKNKNIFIAFSNIILLIIMVTINALAVILPINGKSTGELSDKYQNLFVPAGKTFSIWGIIYTLLIIFVIYQIIVSIKLKNEKILNFKSSMMFGVTCILNSLWILAWHYEIVGLSVVIMILLLLSLIYIFVENEKMKEIGVVGEVTIKLPISVYLGWISVATIANITAFLVSIQWNGFGIAQDIWTIIMIVAGGILALLMLILKKNIAYSLVVIWAYYGIIIKRSSQEIVYQNIINTCYAVIAVIIVFVILTLIKKVKKFGLF